MTTAKHACPPNPLPVGPLEWPPYAAPGKAVKIKGVPVWGRARVLWRCCGQLVVEFTDASPARFSLDEIEYERWPGTRAPESHPVPCDLSPFSLDLPCGHMAGEGCDCDTIQAGADAE